MSALVERLIASRDTLKTIERRFDVNLQSERQALAEAANALDNYERTMKRIAEDDASDAIRLSEMRTLLDRLHEHVRPTNWDDDDDPEQVAVWLALDKLRLAPEAASLRPASADKAAPGLTPDLLTKDQSL